MILTFATQVFVFDSVLLKDALNSEMRVEEVLRKEVPQRGQDPET